MPYANAAHTCLVDSEHSKIPCKGVLYACVREADRQPRGREAGMNVQSMLHMQGVIQSPRAFLFQTDLSLLQELLVHLLSGQPRLSHGNQWSPPLCLWEASIGEISASEETIAGIHPTNPSDNRSNTMSFSSVTHTVSE